jgi:hypothetical protein
MEFGKAESHNFIANDLKFSGYVRNRYKNTCANFNIIPTLGSGFIDEIPRILGKKTHKSEANTRIRSVIAEADFLAQLCY